MDETTKRACLLNALLVGQADGTLDPLEQRLLQAFMEQAGVERAVAQRWHAEHTAAGGGFLPVTDGTAARDVLKLTIGVAAADAHLDPGEWAAIAQLAKALDVPVAELRALVQGVWQRDVLAELFPAPTSASEAPSVLLVTDGFERLDAFLEASPGIGFDRRTLAQVPATGLELPWTVFHAVEEKGDTLARQSALQRAVPTARCVAVIGRHQGYQVSYMLENGLHRCLVEDLYPNELAAVLAEE